MLRSTSIAVLLATLLVAASACDGCAVNPVDDGGPGAPDTLGPEEEPEGAPGTPTPDANEPDGTPGEPEPNPLRLEIEPADAAFTATIGGGESLQLTAVLVDDEAGTRNAVASDDVYWQSLDPVIGTVDEAGVVRSSEERAGILRVRARAQGIEGVGQVTIRLVDDRPAPDGTGPQDFTGEVDGTALGPVVLYPANGVVIPSNLAPILFQWEKTRQKARVVVEGEYGSLSLYTAEDRVASGREAWRRFLVSHIGTTLTVRFQQSDGPDTPVDQTVQSIILADADLTATVYYWAVSVGRIVRIDADSLEPIQLDIPFDDGPQGAAPADGNNQCRACHMLSADGQTMAFTYFGGNGPGGVVDVGDVDAPLVQNQDARRWNFAAPSPDGSLLISNLNRRLTMRSAVTGDTIAGMEDLTGIDSAHPAFSPVGNRVAFAGDITNADGSAASWEIDFDRSNLYVADFNEAGPTFSAPRLVVPAEGAANFYPSFAPTGDLLAYTRGPHSRSAWQEQNLPGALWIVGVDGQDPAPRLELVTANPEGNSYNPTFNPQIEGGYMWIAFFSRRDYGHITRGTERPQIWVAAIDQNASPASGIDPSYPAFWLPGQDTATDNLTSFFAPKPCAPTGEQCETDAGCCGELLCRPDADGVGQCVPPEEACLLTGDVCEADGDCCVGLLCAANADDGIQVCLPPGEQCSQNLQICTLDSDCCEGAGRCFDDGTGTTRCLRDEQRPPGACAEAGESCEVLECCSSSYRCGDGVCILVGG